MAAPESKHEQITAGILAALATINATTQPDEWHYTPNGIAVWDALEAAVFKKEYQVLYLLVPDQEEDEEEASSLIITGRADFDLIVAKQYNVAQPNDPWLQETPKRSTVQNRLVRDASKRLRQVVKNEPLWENLEVVRIERAAEFTREAGWAMAIMRLTVMYSTPGVQP